MSDLLISTSDDSGQETAQEHPKPIPASKPSPKSPKRSRRPRHNDDEDYVPVDEPPRPKKNAKGKGKRRREKTTKDDGDEPPKKRPRKTPRPWSVEEEKTFLAGLNEFGRDWRAIANTLPFRDKSSVSSHAQKHFINLFFNDKPLPAAVLKSGDGYTLSGKPLDENSSACRSYKNQRVKPKKTEAELKILFPNRDNPDQLVPVEPSPKPTSPRKKGKTNNRRKRKNADPDEFTYRLYDSDAPPQRDRPKRTRKQRRRTGFADDEGDEHSLLPLQDFCGDQPFRVIICPHALVLADLHAHLSHEVEIIGFLAGSYDEEKKILFVKAIYPCKRAPVVDEHHNVEADAEAAVEILAECESKNLKIVGWYHSHPLFAAQPSLKDVMTHKQHQDQTFKVDHDVSPFIGLIVGPYTVRNGLYQSEMTFFVVEGGDAPVPMQLVVEHKPTMALDDCFARMTELVQRFPREEYQEKMLMEWKPCHSVPQAKKGVADGCWPWDEEDYEGDLVCDEEVTRLVKVGRSIFLHLGDGDKSLGFAERVVRMLWDQYGEDEDDEESEDEEMRDCTQEAVSEDVYMEPREVSRIAVDVDEDRKVCDVDE